jgi:hypothetical protein
MKGISIAIETVVYLILAVTVLSVSLFFFLSQAGPAQDQYTLEANRDRYCMTYVSMDFSCEGKGTDPVPGASMELRTKIGTACNEMARRFGFPYECNGAATLKCIQQCCITCPQKGTT